MSTLKVDTETLTEKGLRVRLMPEVFTLLDLHSCYMYFWTGGDGGQRMRIRHLTEGDTASNLSSAVDIAECNWDNIEAWKDAIDLCCKWYREAQ